MNPRAATTAAAVAGLVAMSPLATPVALAGVQDPAPPTTDKDGGNGNVQLLNGVDLIPVQACGLQVPILSGILQAPDGHCGTGEHGAAGNAHR